jgi:RNA polymerase sigma factor (sigma-70 family)
MWRCGSPACNCELNRRRYLDSDQAGAEELVRTLTPMVEAAVRKKLPYAPPEDHADVRQETFLRVFRYIGAWRGECFFCLWVRQVAIRAAYDQARSDRQIGLIPTVTDDPDGVVDWKTEDLSPQVWACIERTVEGLPTDMRRAYEVRTKEGMTLEETAKTVGKSAKTIYNWLQSITIALLDCLD